MKNAHQDGRVLDITLEAPVESGGVIVKGKLFAIAVSKGIAGDVIAGHVEGVFRLAKTAGTAIAVGDALTWDTSASSAIKGAGTSGDVVGFGFATEAAASAATQVLVRLTPGAGVATA